MEAIRFLDRCRTVLCEEDRLLYYGDEKNIYERDGKNMIQDIFPYKLDNQYKIDARPKNSDWVIVMKGKDVLIDEKALQNHVLEFPNIADLKSSEHLQYLFCINEDHFYLYQAVEDFNIDDFVKNPEQFCFADFADVRHSKSEPKHLVFALFTAKHLADWYRDTKFCGRCGKPMKHSENERAMKCTCCQYTAYPRIMPAVIVGVKNKDRILLTKYREGYRHNALVAGFTEIGETVEETVQREVMEEVGLKVKNLTYYKSQPWGTANDILLGFYCDVDGDDSIHMDEHELKYAEWVKREDIVLQPDDFSLTNEMMMMFKKGTI